MQSVQEERENYANESSEKFTSSSASINCENCKSFSFTFSLSPHPVPVQLYALTQSAYNLMNY